MSVIDTNKLDDLEMQEPENSRAQNFQVFNPVKIGGHIKYNVRGIDAEGEFEEVQ